MVLRWHQLGTNMSACDAMKTPISNRQRRFEAGLQGMSSPAAGMTLIELMIAMTVLAIGLPACLMMVLVGMQANSRNKTDTTATILDQEIIEKFSTLKQ